VKSDARFDQLITFARFFGEALPKDRDLPEAALNQTCAFQLTGSIRDGWPLNTQISARRLWVIGSASSSLRSRIMSSQRARRCLRLPFVPHLLVKGSQQDIAQQR
jgi:hypothetical protein